MEGSVLAVAARPAVGDAGYHAEAFPRVSMTLAQ